MLNGIWLVIALGRDIFQTNIFTKFDDYTMKTIEVIDKCSGRRQHVRTHAARTPHVFP